MGGHLDEGYAQIPWHWTRNIIFGQSFEAPSAYAVKSWSVASDSTAQGIAKLDNSTSAAWANPNCLAPSLLLNYTGGTGILGWANRGMGGEGLWIAPGGREYQGTLIVRSETPGTSIYVVIRPRGGGNGAPLAEAHIPINTTGTWEVIPFTLTPSTEGTSCDTITPGSDPTIDCGIVPPVVGNVCVKCGGEFVVGLDAPGVARVGFVDLGPGAWGSFITLASNTVQTVKQMGITAIRMGGSVGETIVWKEWRGLPWKRAAMQAEWISVSIAPLSPFEFIDAARAADIVPIVTMSAYKQTAQDWADLVDYTWGDESTVWGNVRIHNDSHPEPYNITMFELGSE
jgi:hypothetical protein